MNDNLEAGAMKIVDSRALAEFLQMKHRSVRVIWKKIPHFFVGQGRDLRAARRRKVLWSNFR